MQHKQGLKILILTTIRALILFTKEISSVYLFSWLLRPDELKYVCFILKTFKNVLSIIKAG